MRWITFALLVGFFTACSAGNPTAVPESGSPLVVEAPHNCKLPKQKLSPNGGLLKLPACGGFSGKLPYPKFSGAQGTISAALVAGTTTGSVGHVPQKIKGKTLFYVAITFTSTSSLDTTIQFYGTQFGASNGGKIFGPFEAGIAYWGDLEIPQQSLKTVCGFAFNYTPSKSGELLGIPFPGTPVLTGARNFLLIGTHNCG